MADERSESDERLEQLLIHHEAVLNRLRRASLFPLTSSEVGPWLGWLAKFRKEAADG